MYRPNRELFPVDVKLGGTQARFLRFARQVGKAFLFTWSGSGLLSSLRPGGAVKATGIGPIQNRGYLNPPVSLPRWNCLVAAVISLRR